MNVIGSLCDSGARYTHHIQPLAQHLRTFASCYIVLPSAGPAFDPTGSVSHPEPVRGRSNPPGASSFPATWLFTKEPSGNCHRGRLGWFHPTGPAGVSPRPANRTSPIASFLSPGTHRKNGRTPRSLSPFEKRPPPQEAESISSCCGNRTCFVWLHFLCVSPSALVVPNDSQHFSPRSSPWISTDVMASVPRHVLPTVQTRFITCHPALSPRRHKKRKYRIGCCKNLSVLNACRETDEKPPA